MGKPHQKEENAPNPSVAKTEKSPLSEPTLKQQRKPAEGATMAKAEKAVSQGGTAENQGEPQGAGSGRFPCKREISRQGEEAARRKDGA